MRDTYGLIPPDIRAKIEREEFVEHQYGSGRGLDAALRALDPDLSLVFIRDLLPEHLPDGAIGGRWHVRRRNQGIPPSFFPITAPDGGYREPDSGVLSELASRDLWRKGAMADVLDRTTNRRKPNALADEQRRDQLAEDLRAGKRVAGEGGLRKRKWGRG